MCTSRIICQEKILYQGLIRSLNPAVSGSLNVFANSFLFWPSKMENLLKKGTTAIHNKVFRNLIAYTSSLQCQYLQKKRPSFLCQKIKCLFFSFSFFSSQFFTFKKKPFIWCFTVIKETGIGIACLAP